MKTLFNDVVHTTKYSIKTGAKFGVKFVLIVVALNVISFVLMVLMGRDPFDPYIKGLTLIDTVTPASYAAHPSPTYYPPTTISLAVPVIENGGDV